MVFFFVNPLSLFVLRSNLTKPWSASILSMVLNPICIFSDDNLSFISSADKFCFLSETIFACKSFEDDLSLGPGFLGWKNVNFPCLKSLTKALSVYSVYPDFSITSIFGSFSNNKALSASYLLWSVVIGLAKYRDRSVSVISI